MSASRRRATVMHTPHNNHPSKSISLVTLFPDLPPISPAVLTSAFTDSKAPKFYTFFSSRSQGPPKAIHSTSRTLRNVYVLAPPNKLFQPRALFLGLDLRVKCLHETFPWKLHRNPKFNVASAKIKVVPSQTFSSSSNLHLPTHEHSLSCRIARQG